MAHEETQKKKRFGAGRIAEKKHDTANEETQKKARHGAQRKKKRARIAHEEINKTRDGRCMRKFQKPGFSGAKNDGINCAFSLWNSQKRHDLAKERELKHHLEHDEFGSFFYANAEAGASKQKKRGV